MNERAPLTVENASAHLDYLLERIKGIINEVEGLRVANEYLSTRLDESHKYRRRVIAERDAAEYKYEALRTLVVTYLQDWSENKPSAATIIRLHEVLGLTQEEVPPATS